MKRIVYLVIFLTAGLPALAQEETAAAQAAAPVSSGISYMELLIIVFIITALLMLGVALVLLRTFKVLTKELSNPSPLAVKEPEKVMEFAEWAATEKKKPGILNRILGLKPMEQEKDLLMEHEFDGITELDNPTPAWFNWLFYGTIFFGVLYLLNFHVLKWGKLQDEEYAVEVQQAEAAKKAYLEKSGNNIDENTAKENQDAAVISAGQAIYAANCIACHGDKGQGTVGPNLTDEYWLHGGSINNIFKTIKYGVPEKGMISWEKTLSPKQIEDVANYIISLKGTNPPNPKAPQGEKE